AVRNSDYEVDTALKDDQAGDAIMEAEQKIKDVIQELVDRHRAKGVLAEIEELKLALFEMLEEEKKARVEEHGDIEKKYQALVTKEKDEQRKEALRAKGKEEYDAMLVRMKEEVSKMEKQFADMLEELADLDSSGAKYKACGFNLCQGDTLECCEGLPDGHEEGKGKGGWLSAAGKYLFRRSSHSSESPQSSRLNKHCAANC
ncbi:unnamed protein product, partial [Symbiodinium sp. CCMP2456]